ncbi:hypothetical protein HYT53_03185 [Candidatus Woesearchaeota archaeon]|nr:hypothetical protein [Candidatus Woesearchaeota archaeon]
MEEKLMLFGMKNLLLEKELEKLERDGIDMGHIKTLKKGELVDTELFEYDILKKAKKMADFYVLYFSLENSVRKLIRDILAEKYGENWWDTKIPSSIKNNVSDIQKKERESAMTIRSEDPLDYTNFGELIDIFSANWSDFSNILRSQKSVQEVLSPLNKIRNVIAHSCDLSDDEILRFKILIKDWLRIQND